MQQFQYYTCPGKESPREMFEGQDKFNTRHLPPCGWDKYVCIYNKVHISTYGRIYTTYLKLKKSSLTNLGYYEGGFRCGKYAWAKFWLESKNVRR